MSATKRFEWLAFFRLLRLPNVFTAWSDVLMGFLVAQGAFPKTSGGLLSLGLLVAATTGLYLGGMVLNDWFDFEEDQKVRSFRPLPSGKFSLRFAAVLGFGLLIWGVVFATIADALWSALEASQALVATGSPPFPRWMIGSHVIAAAIAIAVLAYNGLLKKTPVGPLSMGLCRTLNILLGMSLTNSFASNSVGTFFSPPQYLIAIGIGVYIAGVTWFARKEETQSPRIWLLFGFVVMALGILLVAIAPAMGELPRGRILGTQYHWLMLLVGGVVAARAVRAIADPQPAKVQMTIKIAILSLIWLDAAIALRVSSFQDALCIAVLIIPALLIGRAVYST